MSNYAQKLRDPRWQKRRLQVLEAAAWKCEDCGRMDVELQVHHTAYRRGFDPWEYDLRSLMAVCDVCHKTRQEVEDRIRMAVGQITRLLNPAELQDEF